MARIKPIRAVTPATLRIRGKCLSKALLILKHSHNSSKGFLDTFDKVRGRGATTYEQQDLLRGMLTFALAGLDSLVKQLIRDSLPLIINHDDKARELMQTFLSRKIRDENKDSNINNQFLARIFCAPSIQDKVIQEYIYDLTGKSLQSSEELMKAIFALGLDPIEMGIDPNKLNPIFRNRNNIIHELDIDFAAPKRNRKSRSRSIIVDHTNKILKISEDIFIEVTRKVNI